MLNELALKLISKAMKTHLRWLNHKPMEFMFLLDLIYLGNSGRGLPQRGEHLAVAQNQGDPIDLVFSITYYLELHNTIIFYRWCKFLPNKMSRFVMSKQPNLPSLVENGIYSK